ncbi:MAG: segregation/condensation protein A [Mariprofundaceae bacterium]|nr:segregation/condensation protein A [Mariprofundaceae bacterium]
MLLKVLNKITMQEKKSYVNKDFANLNLETQIPDLPPVALDAFEGPLDILLQLIRKQKMDIFNIPLATLTAQYLHIIESQTVLDIDVSGEYLVMASTLMQLKSRLLLPRPEIDDEGNAIDPRETLVAQLLAYEQYRLISESLNELPRMQRDVFKRCVFPESEEIERPLPEANLDDLLAAFAHVIKRMKQPDRHRVMLETMSVREQMKFLLEHLQSGSRSLADILVPTHHREAWVTTLLALLELWRQRIIQVIQEPESNSIMLLLSNQEPC